MHNFKVGEEYIDASHNIRKIVYVNEKYVAWERKLDYSEIPIVDTTTKAHFEQFCGIKIQPTIKKKIALFKNNAHYIRAFGEDEHANPAYSKRITNWVEVEFPILDKE